MALDERWTKGVFLLILSIHLSCGQREGSHTAAGIRLSTLTDDTMEGSYTSHVEKGLGIRFVSKPNSLSITTLDGEPLLVAEDSQGASRVVDIAGWQFVQQTIAKGRNTDPRGYGGASAVTRDYAVPVSKAQLARGPTPRLLNATQLALQAAVQDLLARPEALLIESAALALGEIGITGLEYPATLPFSLAALQVKKLLVKKYSAELYSHHDDLFPSNRLKRSDCLSECPPCPDDDCLGLCGYGCNCWKVVCGDCCYHLGCYDHDVCCREKFIQTKCLFPFTFRCESNYSC